jgi:hypothetical protein
MGRMTAEGGRAHALERSHARQVRWGLLATALLVGVAWLPILLMWGDAPFAVTFDDAWYYFEIGRNIAEGHGSTFDTINDTNGYHPLWMLVSVAVYKGGLDDLVAVRTLLAIQLACWVGALALVAHVAASAFGDFPGFRDRIDGVGARWRATATASLMLFLLGANPYVIKTTVNGLESGLVVLVAAALLAVAWARKGSLLAGTSAGRWALGGLFALAFLARTDALVLIGCAGLWAIAEAIPLGRAALGRLVQVFGPAAVTMLAWFAWSAATFGDPRQVSGEIKRLPLTVDRALVLLFLVALALAIAVRAFRRTNWARVGGRFPATNTFLARTGWFAAALVIVIGYYSQLSAQQWLWYYAPHVLYLTFLAVLVAGDFCEGAVREAPPDRSAGLAMAPVQFILVGVAAAAFALSIVEITDPNKRSIQLANRAAGEWITEELPPDAVLGSWDAGVVGYFTDQPIMNLDGVVNSFEWLDARREGRTSEFLRDRDLGFTVNHAAIGEDGQDESIRDDVAGLLDEETAEGITLVHREEFTYTGRVEGTGDVSDEWAVFVYEIPG